MSAVLKIEEAGIYDHLTNDQYRKSDGISKSGLDLISVDASYFEWDKNAPVDKTKLKTLDFGTDFHAFFLEPEEFEKNYKKLPVFNRRKKDEKQAELDLIEAWKKEGITSVTDEEFKKLNMMRDSAHAHPVVKDILKLKGTAERSIFWSDDTTGELCKCRPDLMCEGILKKPSWMMPDSEVLVVDVKTTADINTISKSIENFRYFVQDAFYSEGISKAYDMKVDFIFLFVSTTVNCGKYPVRVVRLSEAAKWDGKHEFQSNLVTYSNHKKNNQWNTIEETDRPSWATVKEDIF